MSLTGLKLKVSVGLVSSRGSEGESVISSSFFKCLHFMACDHIIPISASVVT